MRESVLEAVGSAERVFEGGEGALIAMRMLDERRALVVVYREAGPEDGFVITAFLTSKVERLGRRIQVWPR